MSNIITNLCRRVKLPPSQKAVLMCMADYCHDSGKDWHPLAAMCEWTCLGRSTVIDAMRALELAGIITIKRTGRSNVTQINIERLKTDSEVQQADIRGPQSGHQKSGSWTSGESHEVQELDIRGPGGDTVVQELDIRGPGAGPYTSMTSRHHQEPPKAHKRASGFDASAIELPIWLDRDLWASWADDRKDRRKPITRRGAEQQIAKLNELRKAGHAPADVIHLSIASGWTGLFAPKPERTAAAGRRKADTLMAGNIATAERFLEENHQ